MIKESKIPLYDKNALRDFLESDKTGEILSILDEEELSALTKNENASQLVQYILVFSKFKNELLQNPKFIQLFLTLNTGFYIYNLDNLNFKTYDKILEVCTSDEQRGMLLNLFDEKYTLKLLDNFPYSMKVIYSLLDKSGNPKIINKILNNFHIDLTKVHHFNFLIAKYREKFLATNEERNLNNKDIELVHIPTRLITKDLMEKLWNDYDIYDLRNIVNNMNYSTNTDSINKYVKQREDEIIIGSKSKDLLSPIEKLYTLYKGQERLEFSRLLYKLNLQDTLDNIFDLDEQSVYDLLKKVSDNMISSYIIDYHFEEFFFNVQIDIEELLKFYFDGNIDIDEDHVELYNKIRYIDYLSIEEKINLHNELKKHNIMEMFYDDMSFARRIVREAIKDYSLTKDDLKKYRDEKLSDYYGVDVYVLKGEPFFGLVKYGRHQNELPGGHSFSLVGNGCVATYQNIKDGNTFLYDAKDLNPDQIVHIFPTDSFTCYVPFTLGNSNATPKTNKLLMPDKLLDESGGSYNEILILERGKRSTPIDNNIPELKRIALFCLDKIDPKMVINAKKEGYGILLVKSSDYKKEPRVNRNNYFLNDEYDYYQPFMGKKEKFEKKRL